MGFDPVNEIGSERSGWIKNNTDSIEADRIKYTEAVLCMLRWYTDTWQFHQYDRYVESQKTENVIDIEAPNGDHYTKDDIKAKHSKGIEREDAIDILKTTDKYTVVKYSEDGFPNVIETNGEKMDYKFWNEEYKFEIEREPNFKKIKRVWYDKIAVTVYLKHTVMGTDYYDKKAYVAIYYHTPSKYQKRYTNLFDDNGTELIDMTNISEYQYDQSRKEK